MNLRWRGSIRARQQSVTQLNAPKQTGWLQKARIMTLAWKTQTSGNKVVNPGHMTKKLDRFEMEMMSKHFPGHEITKGGGFIGAGAAPGKSLANRKQTVQIGGTSMEVGALIKDLIFDAQRDMSKYGPPQRVLDHGTMNLKQLSALVAHYDRIKGQKQLYRTDIAHGTGFPGTELQDKRTTNCIGFSEDVLAPFGAPPVAHPNATPQEYAEDLAKFKVKRPSEELAQAVDWAAKE